jgi:hypothetical protein
MEFSEPLEPVILNEPADGPDPAPVIRSGRAAPAPEGPASPVTAGLKAVSGRRISDLTESELFDLVEKAVESGLAKAVARKRSGRGPL